MNRGAAGGGERTATPSSGCGEYPQKQRLHSDGERRGNLAEHDPGLWSEQIGAAPGGIVRVAAPRSGTVPKRRRAAPVAGFQDARSNSPAAPMPPPMHMVTTP